MTARPRTVALVAAVAVLSLLPQPAVGDEQGELAGAAAALRHRSAELRRLIRQEELARRRAAGAGGGSILGPGLPATCPAPRRPSAGSS
jgi:hypothetical protein